MKPIAVNLAQFHEMELNNKWWGKGFTDWDKVKQAIPLYAGHKQPKKPLMENYYDMSSKDTLIWQTELMHRYGVYGMAYYHYWYNNKPLMEKPLENLLKWKDIDQKFLFFWSNCDWFYSEPTNNKRSMMLRQEYGEEKQWKIHIDYLLRFFKDERYICVDDKPVIVIYRPGEIPNFEAMIAFFDNECKNAGFRGIYVIEHMFNYGEESYATNSDAVMYREPNCSKKYAKKYIKHPENNQQLDGSIRCELDVYRYSDLVDISVKKQCDNYSERKKYYCVFPRWDNTSRHRYKGFVVDESTPDLFYRYIKSLKDKMDNEEDFLFINAWNEWAEGMYLEPDEEFGIGYLQAIKDVVEGNERIISEESTRHYFGEIISRINQEQCVYIYGAGVYGTETKKFIEQNCNSTTSIIFVDDTPSKIGSVIEGIPVISGAEYIDNYNESMVLVCCDERSHDVICNKLRANSIPEDRIVIPQIAFLDPDRDEEFIAKNSRLLEELHNMLADEQSKKVLSNVIDYRLSHKVGLLKEIATPLSKRYFDESVLCGKGKGNYIDCGSFIGDSLDGYIAYAGERFTSAICCEASEDNAQKITRHIEKQNYENVAVINSAIWKYNGKVNFNPAGEKSGYVSNEGCVSLEAKTVDAICEKTKIDFLKIEIDGSEYEGILGAVNTVTRDKPVVAISVYHNIEDILRIPFLLKGLNCDYDLYLRFYGYSSLTDIICYAVPKEE